MERKIKAIECSYTDKPCSISRCPAYLKPRDLGLDVNNCLIEEILKNKWEPNIIKELREAGISIKHHKKTWDDLRHKNQI